MKQLIIVAILIWALLQVGGLLLTSKDPVPAQTFSRFMEAPSRLITNPYHNGYFYFFGLKAAPPLDPAHVGYDVWIETSPDSHGELEHHRVPRPELLLSVTPESLSAQWEAEESHNEFRNKDSLLERVFRDHRLLLTRYEYWLGLPFEDWGFGFRVQPRYRDVMAVHRLYIAEGFSHDTSRGLDRLRKEFQFWRLVLREAKTLQTKVFAQVVITDDLRLLSQILARPNIDKSILVVAEQLTVPLTPSEYSLRWPIRNQLALAPKGRPLPRDLDNKQNAPYGSDLEWLAQVADLPPGSFERVEHPPSTSTFGVTLQSAQAGETYVAYYDLVTKASEGGTKHLPRMAEVTNTIQRGLAERILNPHPIEPDWAKFYRQLMETDTRLRLASLQIQLRRSNVHIAVSTRLAAVGSQYFDPFSGLPMLWSPTQHKLYSVGEDRLDDGGDPTFDISVPAIIEP